MKQDPVQDFFKFLLRDFSELKIQDPIRLYLRSCEGSSQDYERGFCQNFTRFLSGSRSNLRIGILSRVIATSFKDLGKKIRRLVRRGNWLVLQSFNQDLVQNFSRIYVSKPRKTMPVLNRILMRNCKDSAKIFTGYWLVHSAMPISWGRLEGSSRIINLKDSVRFDSGFYSGFLQSLIRIFFLNWICRILLRFTVDPAQQPNKSHKKISSRFHQVRSRSVLDPDMRILPRVIVIS